ncbi:hypothetical protein [Metapseudomonas otitidis]|uniref:hypothetical protein n=1 Tax=Metapseudomonas otitidis TaxID=319939 RepID=UPI0013F61B20|nr:hypothetical protein [Pseudomonas otitidis]
MKLCKDCKHYTQEGLEPVSVSFGMAMCTATAISLVDGVPRHSVDVCTAARGRNGRCGLDGRLYEPVELIETTTVPDISEKVGRKPRTPKASKESADVQAE